MAEIVRSVDVDVPAHDLWVAVTDWRRQGEWIVGTRVVPTYQDGRGVGGRVEAVTGVGPLAVHDPMEITAWDPPHRCEVRHLGRVIRGTGAFEVVELGPHRSRFVWAEWVDPPFGLLGDLLFPAVRPAVAALYDVSLRRLAAWVLFREAG